MAQALADRLKQAEAALVHAEKEVAGWTQRHWQLQGAVGMLRTMLQEEKEEAAKAEAEASTPDPNADK